MEQIYLCGRYALAAYFFFYGMNGFMHFYPIPRQQPQLEKFIQALAEAQFVLPTVKALEVLCSLLLLNPVTSRLALILLLPIVFGICAAQWFLNGKQGYFIIAFTGITYSLAVLGFTNEFLALMR